jgi:uncharacterized protein (DUF2141 family)
MLQFLLLGLTLSSWSQTFPLAVKVENFKNAKGHVLYILFNGKTGFPDDPKQSFRQGKIPSEEAARGFQISDIPAGDYALSLIHDENDNDKLDTNFIGIPKEGFGFSNNPKIRFGAPGFEKCRFEVKGAEQIKIELKHF